MMRRRSGAGALSEIVRFLEPDEIDDGYGGTTIGYVERFTESARLQPRVGGETVQASRLAGLQPYTMTVRSSGRTRSVTPEWRAVNVRTGDRYNIKSVANIDERNAYLELLVVAGDNA